MVEITAANYKEAQSLSMNYKLKLIRPKSKACPGRISTDHGLLLAPGGGLVRKQLSYSRKKQSETRTTFLLSRNTFSAFTLLLSSFA
jgi:hypothetical protein